MSKFPHGARCVYCTTAPANTVDHIPPKSLFSKDNRNALIRVPSCRECNGSFAKDDEYFQQMLAMREEVVDIPDAKDGRERMFRAMARDDHRKMRKAMIRSLEIQDDWSGGIYHGLKATYRVDNYRIGKTVSRTIKGLFFHELKEVLNPEYKVITWPYEEISQSYMGVVHAIYDACSANGNHNIGGGVFEYAYVTDFPQSHWSYWVTRFYRNIRFVSVTVPRSEMRNTHAPIAF